MKILAILQTLFTILCFSNLTTSHLLKEYGQVATGDDENGGITANGNVDVKNLFKALNLVHGNIHGCSGDKDHVIFVRNQNTADPNKLRSTKYDGKYGGDEDHVILVGNQNTADPTKFRNTIYDGKYGDDEDHVILVRNQKTADPNKLRSTKYDGKYGGDEDNVILVGNQNTADPNKLRSTKYDGKYGGDEDHVILVGNQNTADPTKLRNTIYDGKYGGDEDHVIFVANQNTAAPNKFRSTKYDGKYGGDEDHVILVGNQNTAAPNKFTSTKYDGKYGGDEDHVILVGNQNSADPNKLKNTKYGGKLFPDVRIQTGTTTDNRFDIDIDTNDRVIRVIAKEVGCLNINTQDEIHKCLVNIPKWRLNDAHRRIIQKYGGDVNDGGNVSAYNQDDGFNRLNRGVGIRQVDAGYNNYNQYNNQNQYHQGLSNYYGFNNQFDNLNRRDMRTTKDYGFLYNNDLAYRRQGGWQRNAPQYVVLDFDNSYQNFYDFRCRQLGDC